MPRQWDEASGRYRQNGRIVNPAQVRGGLDDALDQSAAYIRQQTVALAERRITLATWQQAVEDELVSSHLAAAALAHGGIHQLTAAERAAVAGRVEAELGHLRDLVVGLEGDTTDGRLMQRADAYAHAPRVTYEAEARDEDDAHGFTRERNVTQPGNVCPECEDLAADGWVEIGTLPLPGERICHQNCRCTIERE